MPQIDGVHIAPNWTSAAGALEGVLAYLGAPLPRHAVMGLTGHAWHACLQSRDGVVALPGGPMDLDWAAMTARYARTGCTWERYSASVAGAGGTGERESAIEWAIARLDDGRPLIGWDFHLHEFGIVYGYDRGQRGFLVDDVVTGEVGPLALWETWPSALGEIELFAPLDLVETDPEPVVVAALRTALDCFAGRDGPADGQARGTAALDAWAEALDGEAEVDRAGNAYTLAVLQGARYDGAAFISDIAENLGGLAVPLRQAEQALFEETRALAPLITLFPFPTGGHGNVANAGLRRAAAMALRRAAGWERKAATAIEAALARAPS